MTALLEMLKTYGLAMVRGGENFLLIMFFVVLLLIGWNSAENLDDVRGRLWAELLFFGLVIWLALAAISVLAARLTRRFPQPIKVRRIGYLEALAWSAVVLVAVPLAIFYRPEGIYVFVLFTVASLVVLFVAWRRGPLPSMAPLWLSVVVGACALVLFAWSDQGSPAEATAATATPVVPGAADVASKFRPLLFMDSSEPLEPVDVEDAQVHGCSYGIGARECDNPVEPTESLDAFDYVKVTDTELRPGENPGGPDSAYYHHVVKKGVNVLIDYWWYFAHNPAPVARNVLCGQALRWLGEACAEHPADWEGMTLVLVPCRPQRRGPACTRTDAGHFRIEEARYAQHRKVVAYPWDLLQKRWRTKGFKDWFRGAGNRPLVFVALSSHASYAAPCVRCPQIVDPRWKERHNGRFHWTNNDDDGCADCLKPLPTTRGGAPASWNAFPGPWGAQHCILFGSYCDYQAPPKAPSFQPRYQQLDCVPANCIRAKQVVIRRR